MRSASLPLPNERPRDRAESELFHAWHERRDAVARDELVRRFLPLAQTLARRFDRRRVPLDDLTQVASLALITAIDRFDPGRGIHFRGYAIPCIAGEIRRYFRDHAWEFRIPRATKDNALAVRDAIDGLGAGLGRSPSAVETAAHVGITTEEVREAMEMLVTAHTSSLDHVPASGVGSYAETVGAEDGRYEFVERRSAFGGAARRLPKRDRLVLYYRFGEDLSQHEIAARVGLSQMQVSRILRHALEEVRTAEASAG